MTLRSIRHSRPRSLAAALLTSTALVAASPAWAQSATWDGSADSDWGNTANWSTNTVPGSGGIFIGNITDSTATNQPIIANGDTFTVRELNVFAAGATNVPTLTVNGVLGLGDSVGTGTLNIAGLPNSAGIVIVSGAGARIGAAADALGGADPALSMAGSFGSNGTLRIENGGSGTFSSLCLACSGGGFSVGTGLIEVTGAGSSLDITSGVGQISIGQFGGGGTGTLRVLNGGEVTMAGGIGDLLGIGSSIEVSGTDGSGNASHLLWNGTLNVRGDITVTDGAHAEFGTLENTGFVNSTSLTVSNGARVNQITGEALNWTFNQQQAVLITGAGTQFDVNGALAINSSNTGAGSADFVIADGAVVNVGSTNQSGLAFGEERLLSVTDATLNMTGGLSMNRGTLVATNSTLNFGGGDLAMGLFFDGNTLTLANTDITAGRILTGGSLAGVGNVINLGGTASGPAGAVGAFNVGSVLLNGGGPGAELVLNHTNTDYDIASVFNSTGIIRHIAGDTIFSGNSNTFAGQTLVTGGTLRVNGVLGGNTMQTTVNGGATLGGSGTIGGTVTIDDGHLAPGNSPGTLAINGNLLLGAASILDFELGSPSGTAGVDSDLINVSGNLILDGTLDVTDAGGFGAGLYRLVNYGGTLVDNVLDVGTVPAGFTASNLTVQTATANQVNLLVGSPTLLTFWDGANTTANNAVDGGTGTWTVSGTNWTNAAGSANAAFDEEQLLIFTGTPGTVTISNGSSPMQLNDGGLQFAVDGYVLNGDGLNLVTGHADPGAYLFRVGDGTAAGANFVATINADIFGIGNINKTDLGTLILNGTNTYTGSTEINSGRLIVNGSLDSLETFVRSGGTLGGTGALAGTTFVNSGATLAPGNSIGTLTVGNIEFAAGSIYTVELNDGGNIAGVNNDLINATGTVTINGGAVHVTPENGTDTGTTYTPGAYTIVTAGGGVSGAFDTLTDDYAFLDFALSYDASNVFLNSSLVATTFCLDGMTMNQCAAGEGTFSLGAGGLFTAVLKLSTAEASGAMDQLSGEVHASAKTALLDDSRFVRESVLGRMNGASGQAEKKINERFAFWGEGFGSWGNWDSDGNAATLDRNISGLVMGGDAMVTDNVRVGAMGGYSHSSLDVDARASAAAADSYTLGAYAGGQWGAYSLNGGVAHSWHSIEAARAVAFTGFADALSAEYDARTLQVYGEAAYDIDLDSTRLTPFANLAHVRLNTDGYVEAGGEAALTAAVSKVNATFSTLGLRGARVLDLGGAGGAVSMGLGWRHSFDDLTPDTTHALAGGDAFTVYGVPLGKDMLALNAGLGVSVGKTATLGISYNGQIGSGVSDHGARASFTLRF